MYKLLLCWRYLLTRYLALACIISVMLGVATLIVVNSVMSGFSTKLKERLHGLLSDVVIESLHLNGFPDATARLDAIEKDPFLSSKIEAMTPTLETFALLQFRVAGEPFTKYVRVIGIDPKGRAAIGGFKEHLIYQRGSDSPSFQLSPEAMERYQFRNHPVIAFPGDEMPPAEGDIPPPEPPPSEPYKPRGIIVGNAIASFRQKLPPDSEGPRELYLLHPGDDLVIVTIGGEKLSPVYQRFVVCDYFKSEMSEYDANYVFVPLDELQKLHTMEDRVTSIQIKLKNYADAPAVVAKLRDMFPEGEFQVATWEDKQGPLLAAIAVEKGILNVLLFLIICVAGFGILAIFAMIVVEKTRDIGILKALGASNGGVMKIFLGYGLLLGAVGAVVGTGLGLTITLYINEIERALGRITGQDVFPRDVYYFDRIPTDIQSSSVLIVNLGAVAIAVFFSVLPALRAAMLHPVRALRYE